MRFVAHRVRLPGLSGARVASPLRFFHVRKDARGTGASDAIMEALLSHARTKVRQLQLTVMADNARARAFYERHGFEVYAVEPQAVRQGDEFCDEASMWLPLAPR